MLKIAKYALKKISIIYFEKQNSSTTPSYQLYFLFLGRKEDPV